MPFWCLSNSVLPSDVKNLLHVHTTTHNLVRNAPCPSLLCTLGVWCHLLTPHLVEPAAVTAWLQGRMPLFATCPDVMPTMSHPETQQHGRCVELSPAPPHTPSHHNFTACTRRQAARGRSPAGRQASAADVTPGLAPGFWARWNLVFTGFNEQHRNPYSQITSHNLQLTAGIIEFLLLLSQISSYLWPYLKKKLIYLNMKGVEWMLFDIHVMWFLVIFGIIAVNSWSDKEIADN